MLSVNVLGRIRPSGIEQHWWTPRWMRVVKNHPGVMVLTGVGALAHIEPANAARQHQNRSERRGRHHLGDALSSDPLKSHQERKLALYRCGKGQSVAQKIKHRVR